MANTPPTLDAVAPPPNPALFPGPEPLTGQHVTLERLTPHHIPSLYETVGSHAAIWAWLSDGPFSTATDFEHWLHPHLDMSDALALYAVLLPSGPSRGNTVGLVSLFGAHLTHRVIELGVLFSAQFLQGTRAGTEVLFLLGGLVFEELGYRRWEWKCDALNVSSRRAAERYGFVYEGTLRQQMVVKGRSRDSSWYSMIDSEWSVCRRVFERWLRDGNFDEQGRQRRRMEEVRGGLR